jgi:ribA/ribD-fused uncharacterized protein
MIDISKETISYAQFVHQNQGGKVMIKEFREKNRWLSNFYGPCKTLRGKTVEHFFQAMKAITFETAMEILRVETPREAKQIGRTIKIKENWDKEKLETMEFLIRKKFEDKELRRKLVETGDVELVEGNYWHDNFWGDCNCKKCKDIKGENHLGIILMKVRKEAQKCQ